MNHSSLNVLILTKINTNLILFNVMQPTVLYKTMKKHLFTGKTTLFNKQVFFVKIIVTRTHVKYFCTMACLIHSHMIK
jgi:hypothetical protein